MSWILRFFAWATAFAPLCYFLMHPYQRALARVAIRVLALLGLRVQIQEPQLFEPFNLGIFAAMCLASRRAPRRRRARALTVGLPILAGFGLLTLVAVVWVYGAARSQPNAFPGAMLKLVSASFEAIPWISAPLLWLLFLGAWELPPGAIGRGKRKSQIASKLRT